MSGFDAKVPAWMVSHASLPGKCTGARGDDLCDGDALGKEVFGEVPGAQFAAFAYCWRRFGPPWYGSDPHKELAQYILGTPHTGIFLTLGLSASPLPYAVGYLMTQHLQETFHAPRACWEKRFEQWWIQRHATDEDKRLLAMERTPEAPSTPALQELAQRFWEARMDTDILATAEADLAPIPPHSSATAGTIVRVAVTAALVELLRPVFVRDVAINILGRVAHADLDDREEAPRSPYAGYGIDHVSMVSLLESGED